MGGWGQIKEVQMSQIEGDLHNQGLDIEISGKVYCKEAVLECGYKFTDRCWIHITHSTGSTIKVHLAARDKNTNLQDVAKEFRNALIDYQLRVDLDQKMRPMRELIIRKAFFPFENEE